MATVRTRAAGAKTKTTAAKAKATTKPKGTPASKAPQPKREAAKVDNTELAGKVRALRAQDKSVKEVATALSIGTGKVMFLEMVNTVEDNPSLKITGTDAAIGKKLTAARKKADEFSSWGFLAARTGKSEAFCRAAYEENGGTVKGEHVGSIRKASRPAPAKRAPKAAKAADPS